MLLILGAMLLHLLSGWYSGPLEQWFHSYGSNVTVSFAVYFLLQLTRLPGVHRRLAVSGYALAILLGEEFAERADLVAGVFDPWDLLCNAIGVTIAVAVDAATASGDRPRVE